MAENWPATLPQAPLIEGYESEMKDSRFISNVDAGLNKVRNRYRAVPKNVTENYILKNSQKQIFANFYNDTLAGGSSRFIREDPETLVTMSYRMTTVPTYTPIGADKDGIIWRVAFDAEVLPA